MSHSGTTPHGNFVGNGGQAYELQGRLIPRDLFENNLHHRPYIGQRRDPKIEVSFGSFRLPEALPFSRDLLVRKLSDLNTLMPSFGDWVLDCLCKYQCQVSENPLPRTEEGESILTPREPVAPIVQIVNRIQDKLHICAVHWERLSSEYKIALLIHEAVYSLLKATEVSPGCYLQSGPKARRIAGRLFNEALFRSRAESVIEITHSLEIIFENRVDGFQTQFYPYRTTAGTEQFGVRVFAPHP